MAFAGLIAPIAGLCFPMAIVLSKRQQETQHLIAISLLSGAVLSLVTLLVVALLYWGLDWRIAVPAAYIVGLPVIAFSAVLQQIFEYRAIQCESFDIASRVTVLQSALVNSAKLFFGLIFPYSLVLILISALAPLVKPVAGWRSVAAFSLIQMDLMRNVALDVASKYRSFPLYRAPQVFINNASAGVPIFVLSYFFGQDVVGFYVLSRMVTDAPAGLVAKSAGDVFYAKFSTQPRVQDLFKRIAISTVGLVLLGLLPLTVVFWKGPALFSLIFGAEWWTAGELAKWTALSSFVFLVARPSVASLPVLDIQDKLLCLEVFNFPLRVVFMFTGYFIFHSATGVLFMLAIASVIFYLSIIVFSLKGAYALQNTSKL